jgi:Leucine-rich repeat (LRR) protein
VTERCRERIAAVAGVAWVALAIASSCASRPAPTAAPPAVDGAAVGDVGTPGERVGAPAPPPAPDRACTAYVVRGQPDAARLRRVVDRYPRLVSLDLSWSDAAGDLAPLAGLASLRELVLPYGVGANAVAAAVKLRPELVSLRIPWPTGLSDLSALAECADLQSLTIIGSQRIDDLGALSRLRELRELKLVECRRIASARPLRSRGKLKRLSLRGSSLVDAPRILSALGSLEGLDLSGCDDVGDIAWVSGLPRLRDLRVNWCTGVVQLPPLAELPDLARLELEMCHGLSDVAGLAQARGLTHLALPPTVDDAALATILPALRDLRTLSLRGCARVSALPAASALPALCVLDIASTEIGDLSPLAGFAQLEELTLDGCSRIADIAPLASCGRLAKLSMCGCGGLSDLAPLGRLTGLRSLALPPKATDADLARVSADHPALRALELSGVSGVNDLTPLGRLTQVTRLSLSRMRAPIDMRQLAGMDALEELDLTGCAEVRSVRALAAHARLALLVTVGSNVSADDLDALRQSLPECRVFGEAAVPGAWDGALDVF